MVSDGVTIIVQCLRVGAEDADTLSNSMGFSHLQLMDKSRTLLQSKVNEVNWLPFGRK